MQIQQTQQQVSHQLINCDPFLQKLFQQSSIPLNELQYQPPSKKQSPEIIKIDRQHIEKGYMSQGEQQGHNTRPRRRKNSLIRKMKVKERKKKTKQNKIYIEMLQNRVLQLQKSLQTATKLNEMNKEYLKKLSQGQHIVSHFFIMQMNGLFVSKQRQIQNIQFLLKQKEISNEALKKQYCNMRHRQGVYGKDRTKAINYYFSQMSQLFFSDTLKYMIKTAQNQEDFFDPEHLKSGYYSHIKSSDDIVGIMGLPNQSISELSYLKEQILAEKKNLDVQFEKFYHSKCQILKTARKMQMIIDSMQRYCNHQQISKMIVFADQYRFKKNISVKQFHKDVFDKLAQQKYEYDPNNMFGRIQLD